MNLSFSTKWPNGEPTHFVEKIWMGLANKHKLPDYVPIDSSAFLESFPKIHTIRKDEKGRWEKGNKIHFIINNRTSNRLQFAPVLEVMEVQKIGIYWGEPQRIPNEDGTTLFWQTPVDVVIEENNTIGTVLFDSKTGELIEDNAAIQELAINDGFSGDGWGGPVKEFFKWFNEDFEGVLIHWTDKMY